MIKKSDGQENILGNIQLEAIKIIEDKLNIFFDFCIKKSLIYSYTLTEHAGYYSKDSFEMMVLSSKEIINLIQSIIFEINNSYYFKKYILLNLSSKLCTNLINNIEVNPVLITSIKEYSFSLKITTYCEDVINKSMSKALELYSSNLAISNVLKGKNIGSFILGSNNYKNMKLKYRKEISNQIEGILLNTKCHVKNQLINYIISTLRMNELKSEVQFMITA